MAQYKREDLSGISNSLEDRKQQVGTNDFFSEGGEFGSTSTSKINAGTNMVQQTNDESKRIVRSDQFWHWPSPLFMVDSRIINLGQEVRGLEAQGKPLISDENKRISGKKQGKKEEWTGLEVLPDWKCYPCLKNGSFLIC